MELGLKNRKAFVTGASRGIGRAIAQAFAAEGIHLALFGRDEARCNALAEDLSARHAGLKVLVQRLDFEEPANVKPAVDAAARALGGVDILVNCAGGAYRGRLAEIPDEMWER
ncbi:MAG TPA: SDR family NAD(P)-dependent oxidoreductase, partial [Burkholderiales bacterium]|nr:SDR family NAD(P)-dependent oxidoreductase [Burkholderiales bacterium]